jgi:hypothetical protein
VAEKRFCDTGYWFISVITTGLDLVKKKKGKDPCAELINHHDKNDV